MKNCRVEGLGVRVSRQGFGVWALGGLLYDVISRFQVQISISILAAAFKGLSEEPRMLRLPRFRSGYQGFPFPRPWVLHFDV